MVGRGDEGAGSVRAMAVQLEEDFQLEVEEEEEEEEEEVIITDSKGKGKGRQTNSGSKAKRVKGSVNHPPYREMITEALVELKERNGSSQAAIAKFIEEKYKDHLQPNFKKVLFTQLKTLTTAGELTRIKNSFKLKPDAKAAKKMGKKKTKSDGAAKVGKTKQTKQPARSTPRKTPKTIKKAKPTSKDK